MSRKLFLLTVILLGLPLLGVVPAGYPIGRYLEFPPQTFYVRHAPFSWPAFGGYGLFVLAAILPLMLRAFRAKYRTGADRRMARLPFLSAVAGAFAGSDFIAGAYGRFRCAGRTEDRRLASNRFFCAGSPDLRMVLGNVEFLQPGKVAVQRPLFGPLPDI